MASLYTCARYRILVIVIVSGLALAPTIHAQSLLWKVTAPTGVTSYLFGTIHLPDSTVFFQRDTVLAAVRSSSWYVSELHLDSLMMPKVLTQLLKRPAFLKIMTLQEKLWTTSRPARTTIDQWLWSYAKQRSIARGGIETIDEQLAVFDQIPDSLLLEGDEAISTPAMSLDTLVSAYVREDLELIARLLDEAKQDDASSTLMDVLTGDRNYIMVERLRKPLTTKPTFVAVGAAHLPGDDGLITLLRAQGFVVEPVMGSNRTNWLQQ